MSKLRLYPWLLAIRTLHRSCWQYTCMCLFQLTVALPVFFLSMLAFNNSSYNCLLPEYPNNLTHRFSDSRKQLFVACFALILLLRLSLSASQKSPKRVSEFLLFLDSTKDVCMDPSQKNSSALKTVFPKIRTQLRKTIISSSQIILDLGRSWSLPITVISCNGRQTGHPYDWPDFIIFFVGGCKMNVMVVKRIHCLL